MRTLLFGSLTLALVCFAGTALAVTDSGVESAPPGPGNTGSPLDADGSLTTLFAQNNNFNGNSFDITALTPLRIVGFDVNLDAVPHVVEIWTTNGTAQGNEQNPALWTLLGTDSVMGAGVDLPTPVNIGGLELATGQLVGVIAKIQERTAMYYTNGDPTDYTNADMNIRTFNGLGDGWPPSNVFSGRMWNGTVYYDYITPTPVEAVTWGAIKSVF